MKLLLHPARRNARARRGHPWVFAGELLKAPDPALNGTALPLFDERKRFFGCGIVNTGSSIIWRRFSLGEDTWGPDFWRRAIRVAIARRAPERFRRLVWSESDDLPGLVVDQYDRILVVQALTLAVDQCLPQLLEILTDELQPADILVRNDAPSRKLEGLGNTTYTCSGNPIAPFVAAMGGISFFLDLQHLQKTGFYLDQRHEHVEVARLAQGRRVLDAFCNQGAFALHCAAAGASEVTGVDASADAIRLATANAEANGLRATFLTANMFDYFGAHREPAFDLIILDPPSFAPNRAALPGAIRGYKELHLRAFQCLRPGGILASYCCSHHVDAATFFSLICDAAADTRRVVELLRPAQQAPDHPVLLHFPESGYLKGWVMRVRN